MQPSLDLPYLQHLHGLHQRPQGVGAAAVVRDARNLFLKGQ